MIILLDSINIQVGFLIKKYIDFVIKGIFINFASQIIALIHDIFQLRGWNYDKKGYYL
ncbi:hypothetical protein HMPREF3034_02556 [Prevotella sp. DNF00663]|nr:hypothetical protein HMPREF3034_02556 [Prevotella sp. DNF00663]